MQRDRAPVVPSAATVAGADLHRTGEPEQRQPSTRGIDPAVFLEKQESPRS
jgi:hypothetical protein